MKDNFDVWKEKELKAYLSTTKWRMGNDPKKNKRYYYDKIEKKSQWNKPEEIIEFENLLIERYNVYIKQIDDDHDDGEDISDIAAGDGSYSDLQYHQNRDIKKDSNQYVDHNKANICMDNMIHNDDMPKVTLVTTTHQSDDNIYSMANSNDNVYHSSQSTATTTDSASTTSIITTNHKTIPTYNECISIISEDDSILNPSIIDTCDVLVEHYHVSFNDVVDMLVKSYKGYPSIIAAVIECIRLTMTLKDASPSELDRYVATTSTNAVSTTSSAVTAMDNTTTTTTTTTTTINPMMDHVTVAEIAVDDRVSSEASSSSSSSSVAATTTSTISTTNVSSEEILAKIVTNIVKQAWKERYYKDAISAEDGDDGQGHTMPWNHSFMPSFSSSSSSSSSSSTSSENSLISYVLSLSKDHLYSNLLLDLYDTYPNDDILKKYCQVGHVEGCSDKDLENNTDNDDNYDNNDNENDDSNENADMRKRRKLT